MKAETCAYYSKIIIKWKEQKKKIGKNWCKIFLDWRQSKRFYFIEYIKFHSDLSKSERTELLGKLGSGFMVNDHRWKKLSQIWK